MIRGKPRINDMKGQEWSRVQNVNLHEAQKIKDFVFEELVSPEVLMVRDSTLWLNFQPPRSTCPSKLHEVTLSKSQIKVISIVVTFQASHLNTHLSGSLIIDVEFPLFQNRELTKQCRSAEMSAIKSTNDGLVLSHESKGKSYALWWKINRSKAFASEKKIAAILGLTPQRKWRTRDHGTSKMSTINTKTSSFWMKRCKLLSHCKSHLDSVDGKTCSSWMFMGTLLH